MEPNKRENRFAGYILNALQELHEAAEDADAVATHRSLIAAIVENLNEYRAELRPEPTAGDREAAEELYRYIVGPAPEDLGLPYSSRGPVNKIADALSAARGNRAELEAAAREAAAEACEFCRYGKKELPGRRDYCKSEHCQWIKIIDALAAILEGVKE